jgi:hypothetical protein
VPNFVIVPEQRSARATGLFISKDVSGRMHCAPMREDGLLLARALPMFTVGIEVIMTTKAGSCIVDRRSGHLTPIPVGDYTGRVTIVVTAR